VGPVSKEEAETLCQENEGGANGSFCVRTRPDFPNQFVLTVMFKGKPTNHLIRPQNGKFLINKKSYGNHTSMVQVSTPTCNICSAGHTAVAIAQCVG